MTRASSGGTASSLLPCRTIKDVPKPASRSAADAAETPWSSLAQRLKSGGKFASLIAPHRRACDRSSRGREAQSWKSAGAATDTTPAMLPSVAAASIASAPPVPNPMSHNEPSDPSTPRRKAMAARRSLRQPSSEKWPWLPAKPRKAKASVIIRAWSATRSARSGRVRNEFAPPPASVGNPGTSISAGRPLSGTRSGCASQASSDPAAPSIFTCTVWTYDECWR